MGGQGRVFWEVTLFRFDRGPIIVDPPDISPFLPLPPLQLYWISPLTYAQQAIFLNEFTDPRWDTLTDDNGGQVRLGDAVLMSRGLWTDK